MRRVFKTRHFSRWLRKTELTNEALCGAVTEMERGLIDADLGGGLVKKRVPLPGRGKSGGTRTLLATNRSSRWFFVFGVFGFEKSRRANVDARELEAFKKLAGDLLELSLSELEYQVSTDALQEICHDDQNLKA